MILDQMKESLKDLEALPEPEEISQELDLTTVSGDEKSLEIFSLKKRIIDLNQEIIEEKQEVIRLLIEQEAKVGDTTAYKDLLADRQEQVKKRFQAEGLVEKCLDYFKTIKDPSSEVESLILMCQKHVCYSKKNE